MAPTWVRLVRMMWQEEPTSTPKTLQILTFDYRFHFQPLGIAIEKILQLRCLLNTHEALTAQEAMLVWVCL